MLLGAFLGDDRLHRRGDLSPVSGRPGPHERDEQVATSHDALCARSARRAVLPQPGTSRDYARSAQFSCRCLANPPRQRSRNHVVTARNLPSRFVRMPPEPAFRSQSKGVWRQGDTILSRSTPFNGTLAGTRSLALVPEREAPCRLTPETGADRPQPHLTASSGINVATGSATVPSGGGPRIRLSRGAGRR